MNLKLVALVALLYVFFLKVLMPLERFPRYFEWLPTFTPVYDNRELNVVKREIRKRTPDDERFFLQTDASVVHAFAKYAISEQEIVDMKRVITHPLCMIWLYLLKYFVNRPRPYQLSPHIDCLKSSTGNTPAYPAGHAYQAHLLAAYLGRLRPHRAALYDSVARRCDLVRVRAGIHYPSDGRLSRKLVKFFMAFI